MTNIIMDYDGTLHDSIQIYAPSFRKAYEYLVNIGFAQPRNWQDNEISRWLGYSSKDMWELFMPNLPDEIKATASNKIGEAMLQNINDGMAKLYPHSLEVLQTLKDNGLNLIFLSNCKEKYMDTQRQLFGLQRYFNAFYCTENYNFKPKYEIFDSIKEQFHGDFIVIGDRYQDIEVAIKHNLKSIGCAYGFGLYDELKAADIIVNDVTEIPLAVSKLL
ncbi:MAG: HAD hydrolase-like protein [Oscillospiraceae bacterium]